MKFVAARVRFTVKVLSIALLALSTLFLQLPARAADQAGAKLFHDKCAACHGANGKGNTPVGKALKIGSLLAPDVQKKTDAELETIIEKGRDKMPAYGNTLKPDQVKDLVAYVRELAKAKK